MTFLDALDALSMQAMATAGLATYTDGVYTPPDGGDEVGGVYVVVDDLIDELTGNVTQNGAVLYMRRSIVGPPIQGATVKAGGVTWRVGRRLPTEDPSLVACEAHK